MNIEAYVIIETKPLIGSVILPVISVIVQGTQFTENKKQL